jgi:hypothetical protein
MPQKKFDGVIEAVRYTPEGKIAEVRFYERRGPTYSDRLLIGRSELVQRLRGGKKFAVGARKLLMASTFEITGEVRLAGTRGHETVLAGLAGPSGERDDLSGAPLF